MPIVLGFCFLTKSGRRGRSRTARSLAQLHFCMRIRVARGLPLGFLPRKGARESRSRSTSPRPKSAVKRLLLSKSMLSNALTQRTCKAVLRLRQHLGDFKHYFP